MKKRIFAFLLAGLLTCFCLFGPLRCALGFGDFDSDTDYGGSDYDSSSDYGDSSDYGSDHDSDSGDSRDRDYGSSGSRTTRRSGSKGSGGEAGAWIMGGATILFFGAAIYGYVKRNSTEDPYEKAQQKRARHHGQEGVKTSFKGDPWKVEYFSREAYQQMLEEDPDFSQESLEAYVRKLFTEMQTAWEAGDIHCVQYGFVPDTWERFNTQLQMKNWRKETTHVREIDFDRLVMTSFSRPTSEKYSMTVTFRVAYNVWVTRSTTNTVIQGSPSTRHEMTFRWRMERPQGARTVADTHHCPNCGAELDVSAFAECPFCHTKMTKQASNWLIRDIESLRQKTLHK